MPNDTSEKSETVDDGSAAPSVLDFLYHDSRRIGSFLAQFEGDGHLQQLTRTRDGSRGKKEIAGSDVKGGVGFLSGGAKGSVETSVDMTEAHSRVFDPFWANARAFLNYISEYDMLQRGLSSTAIGQFVMVRGYLSILDLAMLKESYKLPAINKKILSAALPSKPLHQMTATEKAAHKDAKENVEMLVDMLQILPHSIHATLLTDDDDTKLVWSALREEYLATSAADLTLAHGSTLSGVWSIVGILSAYPEYVAPDLNIGDGGFEPGVMQSIVGLISKQIAPIVRVAVGRPSVAFAVTPLLIFREVA